MSWFRATALAACLAILGGCGFQPLYGQRDRGSVAAELAAVKIKLIENRVGQQLRNFLLDRLNPQGKPATAIYDLIIELAESREDLGIRKDETATRANLTLRAEYVLESAATGEILVEGFSRSVTSYDLVDSDFATLSAEADARKRAVRQISEDIKIRLGIYFSAAPGGA